MPTIATYYELIGLAVSLVAAIVAYFKNKEQNNKTKFALIILMLGVVITYTLSIRYDYMDKVLENNVVKKDALAYNLANELATSHEQVDKANDKLSQTVFYDRLRGYQKNLEEVKNGKFTIQNYEFEEYAPKIFELAGTNSKIVATSYVATSDWWKTAWGANYLQKNYDAINQRHCTIERVYIFKDEAEFKAAKKEMDIQKKNKITIYYALAKDITASKSHELKQDIIIVGDMLCGKLFLTEERKATHAEFYTNKEEIENMKKNFDRLRNYIKPY